MGKRRAIARDETIVAAILKVLVEQGPANSQRELRRRVLEEIREKDPHFSLSESRVRELAVRSGLVETTIEVKRGGPTPKLSNCPVCRSKVRPMENRTLTGSSATVGYSCTQCPWWTGRELRVPSRYLFSAKIRRRKGGIDPAGGGDPG